MRLQPPCVPCLLRQVERLLEPVPLPPPRKLHILVEACGWLRDHYGEPLTTPEFGTLFYRHIYTQLGGIDPYRAAKDEANRQAEALLAGQHPPWPAWSFAQRVLAAIAGNAIDHAVHREPGDLTAAFAQTLGDGRRHGSPERLASALAPTRRLLYLLDNCGEIVLDRPLLAWLAAAGKEVFIAAGDGVMCNDAGLADARAAGLDRFGHLLAKGPAAFGLMRREWPAPFAALWDSVDLVLAKGQAYYETLGPGVAPRVFHLFRVKCRLVADELDLPLDTSVMMGNADLRGRPADAAPAPPLPGRDPAPPPATPRPGDTP